LIHPFKVAMAFLRRSRWASNSAMMATVSTILLSDSAAVIVDEQDPTVLDQAKIPGFICRGFLTSANFCSIRKRKS
jgi:hypothetical protein